jgi:quercetin dioxygenase-like cupin family protein
MKTVLAALFLLAVAVPPEAPDPKIVVLQKDEGEKRVRRPRPGHPMASSEFILKVTPENSGSQHLVLGTETIKPGGKIRRHRHLHQDEILFLQTGSARVRLNDTDHHVRGGGTVFFPANTWVSLENTGQEDIDLIFIFSAPGFERQMRCVSVPAGAPSTTPLSDDELKACAEQGHVEYEDLMTPAEE